LNQSKSVLLLTVILLCSACGGNDNNKDNDEQILISPIFNQAPVSTNISVDVNAGSSSQISLSASDADNDPLDYQLVTEPLNGEVTLDDFIVSYTPNENFIGTDSFNFKVNDGVDDSNISTVDINVSKAEATVLSAFDQIQTLELNSQLQIKLTSNAHFNTPVTFEIVDPPKYGRLYGTLPNLHYVLDDLTYTGSDEFSYRVNDGGEWSPGAKVAISVRKNEVKSQHAAGSTDGIYLHVPNHLAYQETGPNSFSLNVTKDDEELMDESISRVKLNKKLLTVDLADKVLAPPFTIAVKWTPESENNNSTILQTSSLSIHESQGQLNTDILGDLNFNHPNQVTTSACNQATIVVEEHQVTTYLNGVATTKPIKSVQALSELVKFGHYKGRAWDLRVYDHALNQAEMNSVSEDCSDITPTPFANAPLYRCGTYICLWYKHHNEFSEEELTKYLIHQDYFYEHNLFAIGMHPHGQIGHYFSLGRPGWDLLSKERDILLDHAWGEHATSSEPFKLHYHMHEDFHQYQGVLSNFRNIGWTSFLAESTAEWSIVEYTPEARTLDILGEYIYDSHLPMWMVSDHDQSNYSTIRLGGVKQGGHPYGAYAFISYLTREVLSNKIVGDIYNDDDVKNRNQPMKTVYRHLASVGVDLRDIFIEFAARTVTYDYKTGLTQAFRDNEQVTLQYINSLVNPNITEDSKYITIFDSAGTGAEWQSPPLNKRPGSWAYNLYKIDDAQGTYHLSVAPSGNNPDHAEFRAMALLYDEEKDTRQYISLPTNNLAAGIEVTAQGEDIILVVATTPSQRFQGIEQYDYQFKMQKKEIKPVYLMAGQSNMEGHVDQELFKGLISDLTTVQSSEMQAKLVERLNSWYQSYDNGYARYAASEDVATYEAQELIRLFDLGIVGNKLKQPLANILCSINEGNLTPLKDNCGFPFGPELTLGHYLSSNSSSSTSLIKVAYGGTDLENDWLSPSAVDGNSQVGELYEILADKIDSLKVNPESIHPDCAKSTCQWSAFIWFQGEADSFLYSAANDYEMNLKSLILDVRTRVGAANLPVVIVEIGHWAKTLDFGEQVATAQQKIANEDPNVVLVNTDDLSRFFHYDPAAQMIIGERIGVALDNLLNK
jgi:hypothetical protein